MSDIRYVAKKAIYKYGNKENLQREAAKKNTTPFNVLKNFCKEFLEAKEAENVATMVLDYLE